MQTAICLSDQLNWSISSRTKLSRNRAFLWIKTKWWCSSSCSTTCSNILIRRYSQCHQSFLNRIETCLCSTRHSAASTSFQKHLTLSQRVAICTCIKVRKSCRHRNSLFRESFRLIPLVGIESVLACLLEWAHSENSHQAKIAISYAQETVV